MEDQRAAAESIQDGSAAERFAAQLRKLRTAVGNPSFRKMAGLSGRISHTTLHEAAAGTRFPSWETTREFVRACEADEAEWRRRWQDAQGPGTVIADPPAAGTSQTVETSALGGPGGVASSELVPAGRRALQAATDEVAVARRNRLPWLAAAAAVVVAVVVLSVAVHDWSPPAGSGAAAAASPSATPSPAGFSDALIPGDASKFIADVTIPDGTRVKVNAQFVKVWALANVGKVAWHNRFLARMNPTDDGCRVPDRVSIGDTPPGEQVMISVPVTAPDRPGKCWVSWKMVDESGQAYFPSRRPVYFMVTVTG
jgi:hypothetical protein